MPEGGRNARRKDGGMRFANLDYVVRNRVAEITMRPAPAYNEKRRPRW